MTLDDRLEPITQFMPSGTEDLEKAHKQAIYKDLMELMEEGEVSTDKAWNKARDNTIREYRTKIKKYCGIESEEIL